VAGYRVVTANTYTVTYTDNSASSSYHSVQVQYERHLGRGPAANMDYTWGHSRGFLLQHPGGSR